MEIKNLSKSFKVSKLAEKNLDDMLVLCEKNTLFFKHCPPPPTKESLKEDLYALPLNKTMADMTLEEKNTLSHRARALKPMLEKIKTL